MNTAEASKAVVSFIVRVSQGENVTPEEVTAFPEVIKAYFGKNVWLHDERIFQESSEYEKELAKRRYQKAMLASIVSILLSTAVLLWSLLAR